MAHSAERGNWTPNWATHPGEHLAEYIGAKGWSQAEFSRLAGLTPKLVSTIISGANPVSPDTALRLERVLGLKAQVWLGLQDNWDLFRSRLAEKEKETEQKAWLDRFPIKELKTRGTLPNCKDTASLLDALLKFCGIGSPDSFGAKMDMLAVQHRQAKGNYSPEHVFSWLMLGEVAARQLDLPPFDAARFLAAAKEIRYLTTQPDNVFVPRMLDLCQSSGVALVFVKPIAKTRLFGSARWLEGDRALIQMSLRMKTNDHFWWTFFHEAAHLLLHRGQNFLDDEGGTGDGPEAEADAWAKDILIGHDRFQQFVARCPRSEQTVRVFAGQVGLHPGIIVGMLQHEGVLPYTHLNGLKVRFDRSGEGAAA